MRPPIPNGSLRMMCAMINPPKPLGFDVVVDGTTVAVIDFEEFEQASALYQQRKSEYEDSLYWQQGI